MTHLYVAVGEGGLVKVGRSRRPHYRHQQLKAEFRKRGDTLLRFHPFPCAHNTVNAERWIVSELRRQEPATCGTEWFRSIRASEAIGFTRRVSQPDPGGVRLDDFKYDAPIAPVWLNDEAYVGMHGLLVGAEQ